MAANTALLSLLVSLTPAAAQEPAPLSQDEMQQVLRSLRTDFAAPESVSFEALNRAAIEGLLKANPRTMELTAKAAPAAPAKLLSGVLAEGIAAVRPAGFAQEDLKALREALAKLAEDAKDAALILDLRAPCADADPSAAADMLSLFMPPNAPLFTFGKPVTASGPQVWAGVMIVLVDAECCNAAEITAAVLHGQKRAWLAGSPTRGRLAAVKELPLSGDRVLRFTAQRVEIAGADGLFGKGITPDQSLPFDAGKKHAAFALQQAEGLARAVFIQPRPRQNEAALLSRENVELPDRIARSAGQPSPFDTVPADRVMQLAADVLTARRVLGK